MRILAIVAHPDDEIIGVGGTLCKHIDEGDEVKVIILGEGKTSRYDSYLKLTEAQIRDSKIETEQALDKIGVKNFFPYFYAANPVSLCFFWPCAAAGAFFPVLGKCEE